MSQADAILGRLDAIAEAVGSLTERKKGGSDYARAQKPHAGSGRKARKQARRQAERARPRIKRRERAAAKGKGTGTPGGSKHTQAKPIKGGPTMVTKGARPSLSSKNPKIFAKVTDHKVKPGGRGAYPVDPSRGRASAMGSLRAASAKRGGDGRFNDGGSKTSLYNAVLDRVKGSADGLEMHRKDDPSEKPGYDFRTTGRGLSVGGRKVTKGSPIVSKVKSKGSKKRTAGATKSGAARTAARSVKAMFPAMSRS